MRINYFSDIHLEFGSIEIPDTEADVIIAAGDIGIHSQGIEWLESSTTPVVYVAGNHEHYRHEYGQTLDVLREASEGSHVHFLENASCIINDVRFLGCTLWTNLGGGENEEQDDLILAVNDFWKIRYGSGLLEFQSYIGLNKESVGWLIDRLNEPFSGKTVVVTHHAPTHWSWDNDNAHKAGLRHAYCNDLKEILHQYEIDAWFHGHTHTSSDYRCAGTRILCNPRGYVGREKVKGFDLAKVVEI